MTLRPAALSLLLLAACAREPRELPVPRAVLLPADLELQDRPVQRQFEERHGVLLEALADPSASGRAVGRAFGELGKVFHAYDYFGPAGECYRRARELDEDTPAWAYLLAQVRRAEGDWERAEEAFREFLAREPGDVPATVWLAEVLLEEGRLEEAAALFEGALEVRPEARALAGLGRIALARGEPARAVERLERALAWQPGSSPIRYSLGLAYRDLGELEHARDHLEAVPGDNLLQDPVAMEDPLLAEVVELRAGGRVHELRGIRALREGRPAVAAVEFRQALLTDPDRVHALYGLGTALRALGRAGEAIAAFQELLEEVPDHAPARLALGKSLLEAGRREESAEQLRLALALDPGAAGREEARSLATALGTTLPAEAPIRSGDAPPQPVDRR